MNKFGERLKELRLEKGMSQFELGQVFSVDNRTVSTWENSIHEPDFDTIIKIAKYFDVTTDYILGNSDLT